MIKKILSKFMQAVWSLQPLIHKPKNPSTQISDLFVWRNSSEWKTYFDLMDIPGLFDQSSEKGSVTIFLFDSDGIMLLKDSVDLLPNQCKRIDLSIYLDKASQKNNIGQQGTFSVFHSRIPTIVQDLDSFISERGYVSYTYKNSKLRSYVHGNLAGVALTNNTTYLISGSSIFYREYRLQHQLFGPALYELVIVNSTQKDKNVIFIVKSSNSNKLLKEYKVRLKSSEVTIFPIKLIEGEVVRVIIKSRIVMARPLVFRVCNNQMDVFHG
jgi:hypothetical protein